MVTRIEGVLWENLNRPDDKVDLNQVPAMQRNGICILICVSIDGISTHVITLSCLLYPSLPSRKH
jgi:hypothetical protein